MQGEYGAERTTEALGISEGRLGRSRMVKALRCSRRYGAPPDVITAWPICSVQESAFD